MYRYAPACYLGLGLLHPYMEEGIHKVTTLLTHGAAATPAGHFLRTAIQQAQVEIGIGTNILQADYGKFHWLATQSTIKHLWKFIHTYNISLTCAAAAVPPLQQQNYAYIIDVLQQLGYGREQLVQLNRCRLAMEAITLADIVSGDGRCITLQARKVQKDWTQPSRYQWPWEQPSATDK